MTRDPLEAALLVALGVAFGAVLAGTRFGFAAGYRSIFVAGDATGVRSQIVAVGLASLLFAAAYALAPSWGRDIAFFVVPAGTGVAFGAFLFGIGMQLANGCGSGTLAALGSGSVRMVIVLPAFVAGSFWGSLDTPFWDALSVLPPVMLGDSLGWPVTLALYAVVAAALWFALPGRAAALPRHLLFGAILLAGLNFATLFAAGHPWGITWGFALAGAKIAASLGWAPMAGGFWSDGWGAAALSRPLLDDATVLMDVGIVAGAFLLARLTGQFGRFARPDIRQALAAVIGGVLMGYGARLSGGCNVGAFFSGVASFSLHGWLWIVAALAGVRVGIWARPIFALRD
jgi:uncharacterized membrane protein YedE/YeeE